MSRRVTTIALLADISAAVRGLRTTGSEAEGAQRKVSSLERELEKLSRTRYDPSVVISDRDAQNRLRDLAAKLDALARKTADARVTVNDAGAQSKLSRVEASLLALGQKTADPNIDLHGIADAEVKLGALEAQLSEFDHNDYVANVRVDGTARASRSASLLVDSVAMLGPAAVAAGGAASGAVLGLGAAMGTAIVPAGLLGVTISEQVKQMKAAEKQIQTDTQKLAGLTKGTAEYAAQQKLVNSEVADFKQQFGDLPALLDKAKAAGGDFLTATGQGGVNTLIGDALKLWIRLLPQFEGMVEQAAGSVDDLLGGIADFARSPDAKALIAFFETRGPDAIEAFGAVAGNVGKGLLSLFLAFAPLEGDMLGGLQRVTAEFARWAAQVGQTQGFEDLLAYVRTEGPKVWDLLGSLAQALLAIGQAAAPVGAVTLPVIKSLADILTLIAKSPAGPVLVGAALGLSTVNRALTTMQAIKVSEIGKSIGGMGSQISVAGAKSLAAKGGFIAAGVGLEVLASHVDDSHSVLKGFLDVAGGAAIGAAFGPWGAVIGGAGGLLEALSQHSEAAAEAQQQLDANAQQVAGTLNQQTGALTRNTDATVRQKLASTGAYDAAKRLGIGFGDMTLAAEGNAGAQKRMQAAIQAVLAPLEAQEAGFRDISAGVHAATPEYDRWKSAMDSARADANLLNGTVETNTKTIDENRQHILQQQHAWVAAQVVTGRAAGQYGAATQAARGMGGAVIDVNGHLVTLTSDTLQAASATRALTQAQKAAAGFLSHQEAWTSLKSAILSANQAMGQKGFTATLNQNTSAGVTNAQMLEGIASQAQGYAATLHGITKLQWERQEVAKLAAIAHGFGMPMAAADTWARKVLGLPVSHKFTVDTDTADANRNLDTTKGKADDLGRTKPVVKVGADTSNAITTLQRFGQTVPGILGRIPDQVVNFTLSAQANKVMQELGGIPNADGNLLNFANGGSLPSIGAQWPQIQPNRGPRGIRWAETGAGPWEAFISGHPAKRERSKVIATETVHRLGGDVRFADGGMLANATPDLVVQADMSGLGAAAAAMEGMFNAIAARAGAVLSREVEAAIHKAAVAAAKAAAAVGSTYQGSGGAWGAIHSAADQFGWGSGSEWAALVKVVNHESGGNPYAQNPTSTAYGIGQFLDPTWATVGGHKTSDPYLQSVYMDRYIKARYGDPIGAWAHEVSAGWYDRGGQVPPGDTLVHNGLSHAETILPYEPKVVMQAMSGGVDQALVSAVNAVADRVARVERALTGELKVHDRRLAGALPHSMAGVAQETYRQNGYFEAGVAGMAR